MSSDTLFSALVEGMRIVSSTSADVMSFCCDSRDAVSDHILTCLCDISSTTSTTCSSSSSSSSTKSHNRGSYYPYITSNNLYNNKTMRNTKSLLDANVEFAHSFAHTEIGYHTLLRQAWACQAIRMHDNTAAVDGSHQMIGESIGLGFTSAALQCDFRSFTER